MDRKRMKRFLAMLLCVTQMVGFAPHVHAEEIATGGEAQECTHPEASLTETTRTQKNQGVKDITDTTHTRTFDVYGVYTCSACGETGIEKFIEAGTETEDHNYNSEGVCVVSGCGAEEQVECEHPEASLTETTRAKTNEGIKDITETQHTRYFDVYGVYTCSACGETGIEKFIEAGTETEGHEFSSESICVVDGCGYICGHPNAQTDGERIIKNVVITDEFDNSDVNHSRQYDVFNEYECPDCGATYDNGVESVSEPEAHSYDSTGLCACGKQLDICEGEHESVDSGRSVNILSAITSNDNGTHSYQADTYMYYKCWECGLDWTDSHEYNVTLTNSCDYENGVCTACGYVNSCDHTGYVTLVETWYDLPEGAQWADDKNGTTHSVNLKVMEEYKCENCGEGWSEDTGTYVTETENHSYYEGACGACGVAEVICVHEDTRTYDSREVVKEDAADNGLTHTGIYNTYDITYCRDCGDTLSEVQTGSEVEITEEHYFENGVCIRCGYESGCDHPEYEDIEWYSLLSDATMVDEKTHSGTYLHVSERWCLLCSEYLGETVLEESVERTEAHNFHEGECVDCGYDNSCLHNGDTYEDTYYYNPTKVEYIDEYSHSVTYTECTDTICSLCNEVISYVETEGVKVTEEHKLNGDGVCVYCEMSGIAPTPTPVVTPAPTTESTPTPVPTPTPAPTATPTPTPTPEPEEDDEEEDYFVPTPRPNTNTNYRPAATAEPTAEPTPVPTAEPTPVPTVAPAYTEPEMVSTLVSSIAAAEAEGSTVTIEIVGAQEVFTEEEHQQLKQLPVAEQVLVTLSTIGFADVVDAAMATMNVTLSDNAAQIVTQANATMEKMTEVEREEMQKTIEKNFPKTQVQIDGVVYDYFMLEMEIVVDGVTRIESYGFRYDEALGQWIFVKMDTLGVDNAA